MNSKIFLLQFILCTLGVGYILYVGYQLHIEQIQKPYQEFEFVFIILLMIALGLTITSAMMKINWDKIKAA